MIHKVVSSFQGLCKSLFNFHQIKRCFLTKKKITCFSVIFQAGTGDEFLDELLSNDASLDEGPVPDIKVMDSSINMSGNEVSSKLISQPQIPATSQLDIGQSNN